MSHIKGSISRKDGSSYLDALGETTLETSMLMRSNKKQSNMQLTVPESQMLNNKKKSTLSVKRLSGVHTPGT